MPGDGAPRRTWVFLPPALRPVAFALSTGVVALVLWDKFVAAPEPETLHTPGAGVVSGADAPTAQMDVSARAAGGAASPETADSVRTLGMTGPASEPIGRDENLPSLPSSEPAPAVKSAHSTSSSARAAGRPLEGTNPAAMSEAEVSARNEELIVGLEKEKKKMGIAKVLPRNSPEDVETARKTPPAAVVRASAPTLLKNNKASQAGPNADDSRTAPAAGDNRPAPDAGLVLLDARGLASSWVLLGFPGEPPATDFSTSRVVMIKPSATKIVSVAMTADAVSVVYRALSSDETPDPAHDRIATLPLEPRNVQLLDASPR